MSGLEAIAEYHKIQTVFKRDLELKKKPIIIGEYSTEEFKYLADNKWEFTEKVDGTNVRVFNMPGNTISFNGKTDNAQLPIKLINFLDNKFRTPEQKEKFREIFKDFTATIYGEGYGARINKGGGNYSQTISFVVFDINIEGWWLRRADVEDIANKLGVDVVPIIGTGTLSEMVEIVRNGFKSQWGDFTAEGIIAKPLVGLQDRAGNRIITKIKHRDFVR